MQTKFLRYLCDALDNLSFKLISYCSYKHSANMTGTLKNVVMSDKEFIFTYHLRLGKITTPKAMDKKL